MALTQAEYDFLIANGALVQNLGGIDILVLYRAGTSFEFYGSNGTAAGTSLLSTFALVSPADPENGSTLGIINGRLMLWVREGTRNLLIGTDGTIAGTSELLFVNESLSSVQMVASFDGRAVIKVVKSTDIVGVDDHPTSFWGTDGTAGGTVELFSINPETSGAVVSRIVGEVEGGLVVEVSYGTVNSYYVTNGQTAERVFHLDSLSTNGTQYIGNFLGHGLIVVDEDTTSLNDLRTVYITDGTGPATTLLSFTEAPGAPLSFSIMGAVGTRGLLLVKQDGLTRVYGVDPATDSATQLLQFTANGAHSVDFVGLSYGLAGFVVGDDGLFTVYATDGINPAFSLLQYTAATNSTAELAEYDNVDALLVRDGGTSIFYVLDPVAGQLVERARYLPGEAYVGGAGFDSYSGTAGADLIFGLGGDDYLRGGDQNDTIYGGRGDDFLDGQEGDDVLHGGLGNDIVVGGNGNDTLDGGGGDDILDGGAGDDTYLFTAPEGGNITIYDQSGYDVVDHLVDYDVTFSGDGALEEVRGGGGNDTITLKAQTHPSYAGVTFLGRGGNDVLTAGALNDILDGGAGNDTLTAGDGNDDLFGGTGEDQLFGGDGDDVVDGDDDNDVLDGGAGDDELIGGLDDDLLDGGTGEDIYRFDLNWGADTITSAGHAGEMDTIAFGAGIVPANITLQRDGDDLRLVHVNGADSIRVIGYFAGPDGLQVQFLNGTVWTAVSISAALNTPTAGADDLRGGPGNDSISGLAGNDTIRGGGGDDNLDGGADNDTIYGEGGNDTIDGGTGVDQMYGGLGDDTFYVNQTGDKAFELNNEGTDTVISAITYSLSGQFVENLVLTGTGNINATGNSLNNVLKGNSGNNKLTGGTGADTMDMSDATSNLVVVLDPNGDGIVVGAGIGSDLFLGIENLIGGSGNDSLTGNDLNNRLDGGLGVDQMYGGLGNDTYFVGETGDKAYEANGEGTDTIYSAISYFMGGQFVENIVLTGTRNSNVTGNTQNNVFTGNVGNNNFIGNGGADTVNFAAATSALNIVLDANGGGSATADGIGTDTFTTIENITGGSADDILVGNAQVNKFLGGLGNDYLDGGAGADKLYGNQGDDTFVVETVGDKVFEVAGEGTDTVLSSISFSLAGQHVEILRLTGTANINATGNGLDNVLAGNAGNNVLAGGGGLDTADFSAATSALTITLSSSGSGSVTAAGIGTDTYTSIEGLIGGSANDTLTGNALANRLDGGLGSDTLAGGLGADAFIFSSTPVAGGDLDTIVDFSVADDTIVLHRSAFAGFAAAGGLTAAQFTDSISGLYTTDTRVLYHNATGDLYFDSDGLGGLDPIRFAVIANAVALTADDFLVA